jgi:FRG domain
MRTITPKLTPELRNHCGTDHVWRASAFPVSKFRELVEHVARLAYANSDDLLFFRGQNKDYQSKAGGTTLYPPIYREDALPARELRHRFDLLEQATRLLVYKFQKAHVEGSRDLKYKRYVQWSIIQHYQVKPTPLLDLTQSLRVACSFAQLNSTDPLCYVYVLGLPYVTNRISINSEHDIVTIRLLSICPPSALRPYFQEGYLAGTTDVTTDYDSKTELDFRNRLIAKFEIPRTKAFWGIGFNQIPETALYPRHDAILDLCQKLKAELVEELQTGDLGEFIKQWTALEDYLLVTARQLTGRNVSLREAISVLSKHGKLASDTARQIDGLRSFRNEVVHRPSTIQPSALREWLPLAQDLAYRYATRP